MPSKAKLVFNMCRCKKCKQVLLSLHRHDFRDCECGNFTDGGKEYIRRGGVLEDLEDMSIYIKNNKLWLSKDLRGGANGETE